MAYKLNWFVPYRLIHVQYEGAFASHHLQAIRAQLRQAFTELESAGAFRKCHVIVDVRQTTDIPISAHDALANNFLTAHPLAGWVCFVCDNPIQSMVATMIGQAARVNSKIFDTTPAAIQFLMARDEVLASVVAPYMLRDDWQSSS